MGLGPLHYAYFREAVEYFKGEGYQIVADPTLFLTASDERLLWLSFDGNDPAWVEALPLFDDLGVQATFYVSTHEEEGGGATLSAANLRALDAAGHVLGASTRAGHDLSELPVREAQREIRRSKEDLESVIGRPVVHFAYPLGRRRFFNERLRAYCRGIGIATIASVIPGLQHARQRPEYLRRSPWLLDRSLAQNLSAIRVDARWFERLTGRSPLD